MVMPATSESWGFLWLSSVSKKGPEHIRKPSSCENGRGCVWRMNGSVWE